MKELEEIVGAAVRDLADDAPPPFDLATAARTQGRRIRRRRRTAIGSAAVALLLVAATPFVVFRQEREALPAAPTPSPSVAEKDWWDQPYQLPGGLIVTALTGSQNDNIMLDRLTGTYWQIPRAYEMVWGSPTATGAVVSDGSTLRVLHGPDSATSSVSNKVGFSPQWSPDGDRVLTTGSKEYAIWEVAAGQGQRIQKAPLLRDCKVICYFTWLPNGKEIALPQASGGIVVLDSETGNELRTLPVQGSPAGPGAWSPDGQFVIVVDAADLKGPRHVVDVRHGQVIGTVPDSTLHFLDDERILSIQDTTAEVYDVKGRLLETQTLPAAFAGRTVSVGRP
ncbi:WD40 repeat domain-containing protein [Actinoplanes couchii]|uniref:Uncharacterized protein n=1 Tax=Actinoplanes couchii TaxID=403638 RepID=A0ABQ3XJR3_9ACTN|nr:hypothetical protein [Actinoplanes couchii]MDR6324350.1 WD40 repeat protein [Actinoplanes couchii]GID58650.1 hypothetical protein Aco03nite_070540 [Actinoplanes couchii]